MKKDGEKVLIYEDEAIIIRHYLELLATSKEKIVDTFLYSERELIAILRKQLEIDIENVLTCSEEQLPEELRKFFTTYNLFGDSGGATPVVMYTYIKSIYTNDPEHKKLFQRMLQQEKYILSRLTNGLKTNKQLDELLKKHIDLLLALEKLHSDSQDNIQFFLKKFAEVEKFKILFRGELQQENIQSTTENSYSIRDTQVQKLIKTTQQVSHLEFIKQRSLQLVKDVLEIFLRFKHTDEPIVESVLTYRYGNEGKETAHLMKIIQEKIQENNFFHSHYEEKADYYKLFHEENTFQLRMRLAEGWGQIVKEEVISTTSKNTLPDIYLNREGIIDYIQHNHQVLIKDMANSLLGLLSKEGHNRAFFAGKPFPGFFSVETVIHTKGSKKENNTEEHVALQPTVEHELEHVKEFSQNLERESIYSTRILQELETSKLEIDKLVDLFSNLPAHHDIEQLKSRFSKTYLQYTYFINRLALYFSRHFFELKIYNEFSKKYTIDEIISMDIEKLEHEISGIYQEIAKDTVALPSTNMKDNGNDRMGEPQASIGGFLCWQYIFAKLTYLSAIFRNGMKEIALKHTTKTSLTGYCHDLGIQLDEKMIDESFYVIQQRGEKLTEVIEILGLKDNQRIE